MSRMFGPFSLPRMALASIVAAALMVGATSALASAPNPMTKVPQGVNPAKLPGSSVFGDTPANTPETVSFVLKAQNLPQLQGSVLGGLKQYLTVHQFAATYGQSPGTISALENYLARFGIATQAYSDNLNVVANGTAGEFDRALDVTQQQFHVPAFNGRGGLRGVPAQTVHGSAQSPELPASLAQAVLAIFGLTNYQSMSSQTVHTNSTVVRPQAGSKQSCIALTGLPKACNTPADFASDYGLNGLYKNGAAGEGQTLGIVTFAALDPGAPQHFWKQIAGLTPSGRTLTVQDVDGGPGAPSDDSGSGETDLDVEQSGALAPDANVIVYQAPNTDPGSFDALFTAASQNTASTISMSWGESETVITSGIASGTEDPAFEAATDEAFLEMAAQGQSAFVTSGDEAAYDDYDELGTTPLTVDNPGDSPYVTTSGGTTLPFSGTLTGPKGRHPWPFPPNASGAGTTRGLRQPRYRASRWPRSPRIPTTALSAAAAASVSSRLSRPTSRVSRAPARSRRCRTSRRPRSRMWTGSRLRPASSSTPRRRPSLAPARAGQSPTCRRTPIPTVATCSTSRRSRASMSRSSRAAGVVPASWPRSSTGRRR